MIVTAMNLYLTVLLTFVPGSLSDSSNEDSFSNNTMVELNETAKAMTIAANNTFDALLMNNITNILNSLLEGYDKNFRPGIRGPALTVKVDISVLAMGPINELNMEFVLDCYFRQSWVDERLRFKGPLKTLSLNAVKFVGSIWKPDTYIRNGRNSYLHQITVPNKLLRLKHNGEILISQRLTLIPRCPMFLRKFPMDRQACPLEIGSLGHTKDEIKYDWGKLTVSNDITLPQYVLDKVYYSKINKQSTHNTSDEISTLIAHFKMTRLQGFYLLQIYLPCMMIVALSWVSFWINKDASPARVALGVMTVLTMSTLGSDNVRSHLPRVSYSTGLDLYIVACFGFVFLALVEFAVINFTNRMYWRHLQEKARSKQVMAATMSLFAGAMGRSNQMQKHMDNLNEEMKKQEEDLKNQIEQSAKMEQEMEDGPKTTTKLYTPGPKSPNQQPQGEFNRMEASPTGGEGGGGPKEIEQTAVDYIDDFAKVLFPALFTIFNAIYWASYIYWLPDESEWELDKIYNDLVYESFLINHTQS